MNATVRRARLRGVRGAERLLSALEVRERLPTTFERVDVFDALAWLDVRLVFKPLEGLLGAYIRGDVPGVAISTRRPPSVQRFTAAHELGHAVLGHSPSLDSPGIMDDAARSRARPLIGGFASYLQEVEADAFAGAFLLPSWLLARHARRQGWTREALTRPDVVYQLALRCGASFQAVAWALERCGFVTSAWRERLLKTKPRDVKAALGHIKSVANTRGDAWLVGASDAGLDIQVVVGDTVSILDGSVSAMADSGSTGVLTSINTADGPVVDICSGSRRLYRVDGHGAASLSIGDAVASGCSRRLGLIAVGREKGLSRANRARMIGLAGGRVDRAA